MRSRGRGFKGKGRMAKAKPLSPIGGRFENFLREEGIREETTEDAIKAVIVWQLAQKMKKQKITKQAQAERLGTSRSQLNRLLDPARDAVTLASLRRAARLVGKKIRIDLVDAA